MAGTFRVHIEVPWPLKGTQTHTSSYHKASVKQEKKRCAMQQWFRADWDRHTVSSPSAPLQAKCEDLCKGLGQAVTSLPPTRPTAVQTFPGTLDAVTSVEQK